MEGVPRAGVGAFCKRRDEMEEIVGEAGYTSARAHQAATLASRRAKEHGVDADVLQARWRDEAAALGFGPEEVEACFDQSPRRGPTALDALLRPLARPAGVPRPPRPVGRNHPAPDAHNRHET